MDADVNERRKHQQEKVQKRETESCSDAPNTTTQGWQWCHRIMRNSMGSGAQCIIEHRQAPLPCNIVNQEQSDKRVRSWSGRFPRGRRRKYHWPARGKQFQHRIPHVVLEVVVNTWYGRSGGRKTVRQVIEEARTQKGKAESKRRKRP